ncbi:MAG: hypothetical protein PHC92_09045 [Syntrophomonadaceae bacterium]|nr:hypothetical protein [Syntrophomonadaceae bacterium]MDD3024637.1 hypothetical protein [Syntrophomonadaceae bacterium]
MKKNIFGIPLKTIIIFLIILLIIIAASVAYNRSVMNNWNPPESLVGKWTGQSEVFALFKKGISPSKYPEDWIIIEIMIGADRNVTGKIGDAELVNCTIKQNRTWFERLVRIKTDYIITGSLKNGMVQEDTTARRDISIPLNLSDGDLKGSIFEVKGWKYPDPLFPRLLLTPEEK